jgi:quinol monooxygenase YgiN
VSGFSAPPIVGGMCFRISRGSNDPHFYFVVSYPEVFPEDSVLIANMTGYDAAGSRFDVFNDPACVFLPAECTHPLVTKPSCICYDKAFDCSFDHLQWRFSTDHRERQYRREPDPATPEMLEQMRDGAAISDHLKSDHRKLLEAQCLI